MTKTILWDWKELLQRHINFCGFAAAPEQSGHNPIGISETLGKALAEKNNWRFEVVNIFIGDGIYLRVFHFLAKATKENPNGKERKTTAPR